MLIPKYQILLLIVILNFACGRISATKTSVNPIGIYGAPFDTSKCSLPNSLLNEIRSYQRTANQIFQAATQNSFKGRSFKRLKYVSDTFGPRPNGSPGLEKALNYLLDSFKAQGMANVQEERVQVLHPSRSKSIGYMVKPRIQKISVQCTGFSASTLGLVAEIVLIPSDKFLITNRHKVQGKIAVFDYQNPEFAPDIWSMAEKAGAVAIITRSLVTFSIYTLAMRAGLSGLRIPTAIATNEDVDLFRRLNKRGITIEVYLQIFNGRKNSTSRNIMADLPGKSKPEEFVLLTGHSDSWFSQGAQDDGIGIILALQIPKLLKKLNLIPKRTIRSVLWTGDEVGVIGALDYIKKHNKEFPNYSAVLQADLGCFKPSGFLFGKLPSQFGTIGCILNEILKLQQNTIGAKFLNVAEPVPGEIFSGTDGFALSGVPTVEMNGDDEVKRYFWYHHTLADTMSVVNSDQLDRCVAFMATTAYILADLTDSIPRT